MAHYKARVTYKNSQWEDGEENAGLEYFLAKDIVLEPPAQMAGIIQQEHSVALQAIPMFWGGQIPLQPEPGLFIHPGRIISIEILENVEVAKLNPNAVTEAVAKG